MANRSGLILPACLIVSFFVAGLSHAQGAKPIISKQRLVEIAQRANPPQYVFIKDAPILGYRITSSKIEQMPEVISKHLGSVDQTKYTPEYLEKNIGSVVALQVNGDSPDFYIIGKDTFLQKYKEVAPHEVGQKNAKYLGKISTHISDLLNASDSNLVAVLKIAPVKMVRMSEMGFPIGAAATIESPWGEQTKPSGQDAYLVFDESKQQFYMVNVDAAGYPLSYVPAQ